MRIFTHQPFLFQDLNNKIKILFCLAKEDEALVNKIRPWKIFIDTIDLKNPKEIKTSLSKKNIIECNPSLFQKENKLFFSYNKGERNNDGKFQYNLIIHEINNFNFDNLGEPKIIKENIFNGCIKNNMIFCVENQASKVIKIFDFNNPDLLIKEISSSEFNFVTFIRANPIFNKNKIIFTGENARPPFVKFKDLPISYSSFIFDLNTFKVEKELINKNNKNLYKSSLFENYLAYAEKLDGFENRQIFIEEINS